MERPRLDSSRGIGPYAPITRLDPPNSSGPYVPQRRFIARRVDDADRTVLLSAPLPGADPERFMVEADASRRLVGPWVSPVAELAPPGGPRWYASPYLPALPLPVALAVNGGPLPERSVRAIGAAVAETLATAHAQGITHAGVSPAAVLLAADGPRLTCFGAVRAAAPDGERRSGLPGLEPGSLAPEQAAGGRPRPPGDVYALGSVLAYAATGHTVPEASELPPALRPLVSACLTRDPANRPAAAAVLTALAPPTPHATVLTSAGPLLTPGWFPGRVVAALARQSAEILSAEILPAEILPAETPTAGAISDGTFPAGTFSAGAFSAGTFNAETRTS
ncbi:serine/threonine protein kinase [Streptomyces sp. NBC_01619]|uniref:serine/threonine protein kinase n=1 Tax=Streptomyces sp. NBC_01619 TaxID=2975901 RepID=UPI00224F55FF|nr:serine/threonine protein kinase [Streptomyces sp. NBC_01619]MCX4508777.1 serine/threonine protein kinase [Streptomyces sp. NBC_01619]